MKHRLIILLLLIASIGHSKILSDYGLKIGVAASKFEMKYILSDEYNVTVYNETRLSPAIGLFVRFFDINVLDMESELYYLQKGGQDKMELTTISQPMGMGKFIIFDIQFDYLQFQTSIRPKFSTNTIEIYTIIGGSIDYLMGVKGGLRPKDEYKDFIMGYSLGAGCSFQNILDFPILIEILYNSDIDNFYKTDEIEYKNDIWMFRIGINLSRR